jgi:hypothetical protein
VSTPEIIFRCVVFFAGVALVYAIMLSAIRTFVLPRNAHDWAARFVFSLSRKFFDLFTKKAVTYEQRDYIMALYAPVTLLLMPVVWLTFVLIGYMGMYWAIGAESVKNAFIVSGSSLLTLGFERQVGYLATLLSFTEAAIGLILVALLIAYLPTMYTAFSRREAVVTMLEVRAGSPPSAMELFLRYNRLKRWDKLNELWQQWELFFVDIEESHTSLAALAHFRSPQPHRCWVTAAGAILDAAALAVSTIDIPHDTQADLTIRAGYLALRHIASFFSIEFNDSPAPTDPISITRLEFDTVYDSLKAEGVPIKADRDKCWRDYSGWRVNYDTVLLSLCALTMAPYAPWSSDRSLRMMHRKQSYKHWFEAFTQRKPTH